MIVVILVIVIMVISLFLIACIWHIKKINEELEAICQEQHTQNKDILELLKYRNEVTITLLQHSEVLMYLAERDETLKKYTTKYSGIIGEA